MTLKNLTNQKFLEYLVLILFLVIPFTNINHVCIYVILELICLYGVVNYSHDKYDKVFMKYFIIYFIWCTIVTILSVNFILSFQSLTSLLIPPLLLFSLSKAEFLNKSIHRNIMILTILLLFLSICRRVEYIGVFNDNFIFNYGNKIGGGWVTTSTLSLCLIVYTMFFNQNIRNKTIIIVLNIIAGIVVKDSAFYFVLFMFGFLYWGLCIKKIPFYKLVIGIIVIIVTLKFILINLLHQNLHISERFNIYSYWLDRLSYSPIHGIGLGLKLESLFYTKKFPIPPEIFNLDKHIALHAHNYFLDTILQGGIISLAFLLLFLYKISKISYTRDAKSGLAVFFMIFVIIMKNMVDDDINGARGLIYWFFIVLTYVTVLNFYSDKKRSKSYS